jgi:phosphoenolpyruvate carboxykinase (GTP)
MPRHEDLHWAGLAFDPDKFADLMAVAKEPGNIEAHAHEELFDRFFDRLPKEFVYERELLRSRLWRSPDLWEAAAPHHQPGGL